MNGMTLLHVASNAGHDTIAVHLLEIGGPTLALIRDAFGQTALHCAAAKGILTHYITHRNDYAVKSWFSGHTKTVSHLCKLNRKELVDVQDNAGELE